MKSPLTFLLMLLCVSLFIISEATRPLEKDSLWISGSHSPLEKELFYDYTRFENLAEAYSHNPSSTLLRELSTLTFWPGLYDITLAKLTHTPLPPPPYPLFEKVGEGEFWRLFSPILLHGNLIHLAVNLLWLFFLGTLVEQRIGTWRYLLLLLGAALVSNTAQYIMSGANFLGLSGVVMGLVGFIWIRQKRAPWENWPLPPTTITMIAWFVVVMVVLQILFFVLQSIGYPGWSTYMANTAHVVGAASGIAIGFIPYFRSSYERA